MATIYSLATSMPLSPTTIMIAESPATGEATRPLFSLHLSLSLLLSSSSNLSNQIKFLRLVCTSFHIKLVRFSVFDFWKLIEVCSISKISLKQADLNRAHPYRERDLPASLKLKDYYQTNICFSDHLIYMICKFSDCMKITP